MRLRLAYGDGREVGVGQNRGELEHEPCHAGIGIVRQRDRDRSGKGARCGD